MRSIERANFALNENMHMFNSNVSFLSSLRDYIEFGGIRIEDDIVVTENGHRIIGAPIPKSIEDVESICQP